MCVGIFLFLTGIFEAHIITKNLIHKRIHIRPRDKELAIGVSIITSALDGVCGNHRSHQKIVMIGRVVFVRDNPGIVGASTLTNGESASDIVFVAGGWGCGPWGLGWVGTEFNI